MSEIQHIAAFEAYYEMGDTRSYAKVAEQIGKTVCTVERWASKEKWQEEVKNKL